MNIICEVIKYRPTVVFQVWGW